jgi:hypothetical protein
MKTLENDHEIERANALIAFDIMDTLPKNV